MSQSKVNRLWVGIFLVFLLSPFSVFAGPTELIGRAVNFTKEREQIVARILAERVDDLFTTAAKSSNKGIDKKFNKTLDEILEIKKMDRETLPDHILLQLREATMDPMKLIVPDKPGGNPLYYFQDHEYSDVFRAFFQKRLDFNNWDHMESLMTSVHNVAEETGFEIDRILPDLYEYDHFMFGQWEVWAEDLYVSLYSTAMRGVYVDDISPGGKESFHVFVRYFERAMEEGSADSYIVNPHFRLPAAEVDKNGYREMVFEYVASSPERFVGRMADDFRRKAAVLRFWENGSFRNLVLNSIGGDNGHLLNDWDFLLKFWKQARQTKEGKTRFKSLVKASFKNADNAYDVGLAKYDDVFWNTVISAAREDTHFSQELDLMLRSIFKEFESQGNFSRRIRPMEPPVGPQENIPISGSRAVPVRWSLNLFGFRRGERV